MCSLVTIYSLNATTMRLLRRLSLKFSKYFCATLLLASAISNAQTNSISTNAPAKTNRVFKPKPAVQQVPQHIASLNAITAEIGRAEAESNYIQQQLDEAWKVYDMKRNAGQRPDPRAMTSFEDSCKRRQYDLRTRISTLTLQAYEIRKAYGIPEPKKKP